MQNKDESVDFGVVYFLLILSLNDGVRKVNIDSCNSYRQFKGMKEFLSFLVTYNIEIDSIEAEKVYKVFNDKSKDIKLKTLVEFMYWLDKKMTDDIFWGGNSEYQDLVELFNSFELKIKIDEDLREKVRKNLIQKIEREKVDKVDKVMLKDVYLEDDEKFGVASVCNEFEFFMTKSKKINLTNPLLGLARLVLENEIVLNSVSLGLTFFNNNDQTEVYNFNLYFRYRIFLAQVLSINDLPSNTLVVNKDGIYVNSTKVSSLYHGQKLTQGACLILYLIEKGRIDSREWISEGRKIASPVKTVNDKYWLVDNIDNGYKLKSEIKTAYFNLEKDITDNLQLEYIQSKPSIKLPLKNLINIPYISI